MNAKTTFKGHGIAVAPTQAAANPTAAKAETIALAEKHGYGTEAALTLLKMSPRMVGDLLAHAEQIDAQDGKDCWLVAKEQTRKALWTRGVLEHKDGTKRTCGISDLGYRVIGLRQMIRRMTAEIATRSVVVVIPPNHGRPIHITDAIGVPACGISVSPMIGQQTEDPHEATCTPCIDAVSELASMNARCVDEFLNYP